MRPWLTVFAIALAAALPAAAAAQSLDTILPSLTNADPFTLSVDPTYPTPGSSVTITALSSNIDLTSATMTVFAGGKSIYQGNVRSVAVPTGAAGVQTTVKVVITVGGTDYAKTISIRPEDVSLVVEPRATVPPLYPGKAVPPLDGNVRIVAVAGFRAGGTAFDPASLSYVWTVDGARQTDASGIGKSTIVVATPMQYRTRAVSVVISTPDGTIASGASISLSPQEPTVRLYESDPLLGIRFDHALGSSYTIAGAEQTLYAAPFSFPTMNGLPSLVWYLDGNQAQTGPVITLRPNGSGQGSASLSFVAADTSFARATQSLSLTFGTQPSTSFFGL